MRMNAYVAGVGMTRFGKQMDKTLKGLAGEAVQLALADAGLEVLSISSVSPGAYGDDPPSVESPEFLVVACKPSSRREDASGEGAGPMAGGRGQHH